MKDNMDLGLADARNTGKVKSCTFISPIGVIKICEHAGCITNVYLQQTNSKPLTAEGEGSASDLLYEAYSQLNEYFKGKRMTFDLPLAYGGTPFQRKVWRELQNIPYGETRSYEDVAVGIGNKKAVRAVGQANNKNPIMIIVPCHRVINKDGKIGGFGSGLEVKKFLLNLENGIRHNADNQF